MERAVPAVLQKATGYPYLSEADSGDLGIVSKRKAHKKLINIIFKPITFYGAYLFSISQ